ETLLTPRILSLLSEVKVDLFTIDEAHCISEWGHDFRPEYRQLVEMRQRFPNAACLALTATATPRVRTDIRSTLKFSTTNEFVASFNRENLYIEVTPKRDATQQTIEFLNRFKDQSGIIYCFSRRQVDDLAAYLTSRGYSVRPYHAGLEDAERRRNQEAFIRDDAQIIVATIAFGMGINKPNVRFIVHYDLPKSIEGYYQEIGRAGRDGLPAHCLLLYSYADVAKLNYFIEQKEGEERRVAMQHLNAIVRYAEDEFNCRRKPLLTYFGETFPADNCSNCDNCTSTPAALTDITIPAQKFLSCVKRTGEKFGAVYVAEVLLGSMNEKVVKFGHDKVSTHGIGKELNQKQWTRLARQLTQMGYLNQDGEFRTLSLTQKATDALKNRTKIYGVIEEVREKVKKEGKWKEELEYNKALFALLRAKRKDMADEIGVPPYVIFSDRTLAEMAAYYPQSMPSMMTISGVGQVKARQYGERFLEVIQHYCEQHNLKESPSPRVGRGDRGEGRDKSDAHRRYFIVGEAFNAGEGIESLRERYQVSLGTIVDHLTRYAAAGNRLRSSGEFQEHASTSKENQEAAFAAFSELGTDFLKPVHDKLNGALSYDQLKILRVIFLCQQ
ncbi:MAG: RecQ family ATP-dependent DNA helicase, partial [Chloroflexota bacterium]